MKLLCTLLLIAVGIGSISGAINGNDRYLPHNLLPYVFRLSHTSNDLYITAIGVGSGNSFGRITGFVNSTSALNTTYPILWAIGDRVRAVFRSLQPALDELPTHACSTGC